MRRHRVSLRRRAFAVSAVAVAVLAAPAPAAAAVTPMQSAQRVLSLSDQRLSLMRGVMAAKWVSRSPVEDPAHERSVLDDARTAARVRGLEPGSVAAVFAREIATAKVVEFAWGRRWLLHGFPAAEPVPDLGQIRAQLAELSPLIIDALADLNRLRCRPHVRAALRGASRRLIRTRFVTSQERARLVDALLTVRRETGPRRCRR